jgi:hypothetical protein
MRFEKFVVERGHYPWHVWNQNCQNDYTWAEFWRAAARQSGLPVTLNSFRHLPVGYTLSVPTCGNSAVAASTTTAQLTAIQAKVDSSLVQHAAMQATLDSLQSKVTEVTDWQVVQAHTSHRTNLYVLAIVVLAILSLILALLLFATLASVRRRIQLTDNERRDQAVIHEETIFVGEDPIPDPPTTQRELYLEFFRDSTFLSLIIALIPTWLWPCHEPPRSMLLRNYHK